MKKSVCTNYFHKKRLIKVAIGCFIAVGVFFGSFGNHLSVQASKSRINEHEQAVLDYLAGGFQHNGKKYKVNDGYIEDLKEQFSLRSVNLTAEDKDKIISKVENNIEMGIGEGYLVEVKGAVETKAPDDRKHEESEEEETKQNVFDDPLVSQLFGLDEIKKRGEEEEKAKQKKLEQEKRNQKTNTRKDYIKGGMSITDTQGETLLEVEMPIKNTGFSYHQTLLMIIGLTVLFSGSIIVTVKYRLFAHEDE